MILRKWRAGERGDWNKRGRKSHDPGNITIAINEGGLDVLWMRVE